MTARCYVCDSPELAAGADPRSPTCETCKPARREQREFEVRAHWRAMIHAAGVLEVPAGGD